MGTSFIEIETDYFLVEQADLRLQSDLQQNPAATFRRLSLYMLNGVPRLNRPVELVSWLKFEKPDYDDYYYTVQNDATSVTVGTGKTGYELCNVGVAGTDVYGNPAYTPVSSYEYDRDTGDVTVNTDLKAGEVVQFDFYTDGEFERELSPTIKRLLGLAVQIVWENRFTNDWLQQTAKIKDKSFAPNNEANASRANTERLKELQRTLDAELKAYEQNCAFDRVVTGGTGIGL